jgi:hypothetical protein
MNNLPARILATMVIVTSFASPAFAQRAEYNFNTCQYNFYGQVNPMVRQSFSAAPVNMNPGIGQAGASAERLRTSIPVSIYEQTPQRTLTCDNLRLQSWGRKKVNVQQQLQLQQFQQQQPVGYVYVPGQNGRAAQSTGQGGVDYQFNNSGAAVYDSVSSGNVGTGEPIEAPDNTRTTNNKKSNAK